ncbi:MAG TPA: radical SAM protein [Vicinamibacterales bacterium]|nr:radical SAM protein [Vicinamibacterales bacterium]
MIVLYNPLSTTPGKQPLPLSVMSLAAVLEGREAWTLVDGNVITEPAGAIVERLSSRSSAAPPLLAVTVMPGPQLSQAVPVCRAVRNTLPGVPIVWGGYFPTQHTDVILRSSFVDFVVRSQGEQPLLELVDALAGRRAFDDVGGLSWKTSDGRIVHNAVRAMAPLDDLPDLPYGRVEMEHYIHPTYLGRRTVAHNSSFGCPFACSFCAVVAMSNRRWLAQSPARMERVVRDLVRRYEVDAVQMHDMDFFISEARTAEFAERLASAGIRWWALGRIDTLMHYSDATWEKMVRSGLKMVFSGAESASDAVLATMNKGGKASAALALELAARMRTYGVIPEYSFVLGSPPDPLGDLAETFEFIRRLKRINPATEVVLYTYTPVPMDGTLYAEASRLGFAFPATLDEWASDGWRELMMRRGAGIPWMDPTIRRRVRNFERVLNAFYPTVTDRRLTGARRALLRTMSSWRYAFRMYAAPYELRALHRVMQYQRPETTGF